MRRNSRVRITLGHGVLTSLQHRAQLFFFFFFLFLFLLFYIYIYIFYLVIFFCEIRLIERHASMI